MEFSSWLGEFNGSGGLEPTLNRINIRNDLKICKSVTPAQDYDKRDERKKPK